MYPSYINTISFLPHCIAIYAAACYSGIDCDNNDYLEDISVTSCCSTMGMSYTDTMTTGMCAECSTGESL